MPLAIVLILDQVTKYIIIKTVEVNQPMRMDVFFQIVHRTNDGLVGGMFGGMTWVTYLAPIIATCSSR